MSSYKIATAGQYETLLQARGEMGGFAEPLAALRAIRDAGAPDEVVMHPVDGGEWMVWRSEEDYAADSDGSSAIATIVRA